MTIRFDRVQSSEQVTQVYDLAVSIWNEHYTSLIGEAQVAYMLNSFHSLATISEEVETASAYYFLIINDNSPIGYISVKPEDSSLFLSKLYVLSTFRGKGVGRKAIQFIKDIAAEFKKDKITLTVYRHNSQSISAYQAIGFNISGEICADIGHGYLMNDYKMEMILQSGH
ncbi:GNAT family N-acetyltransferase [Veronia pacifica]|uniref:GNAT family N-acetyltransferase n=1 Tax=Veronia pacifica TaxID=1080227 RepID=A0A1C3ER54_9GAMM|nr:GNAT family N-acetyltransferase [Veronia pacifica]ODA35712.1 GNAT family N-acetyltransferase [Veronia pacifica]